MQENNANLLLFVFFGYSVYEKSLAVRAYYILFSVCYFHLVSKMAPLLRYTELSLALSDRYVRSVYFVCHMHACMGDVCVCIYGNTVCVVNVYVLSYCARFDRHIRV